MDGCEKLHTLGVVNLVVVCHRGGTAGALRVSHPFYVVPATVFGAIVIGVDFASIHLQGMRWDSSGRICMGGAVCLSTSADPVIDEHRVGGVPGVHARVFESGKVEIAADDFLLTRSPGECCFTCKWIWRDGEPPSPMVQANRGDYDPSLTSEEETHVKVEVEKMVSNGWVVPWDDESSLMTFTMCFRGSWCLNRTKRALH